MMNFRNGSLKDVKVDRSDLIKTIKTNLKQHLMDHEEAMQDYVTTVTGVCVDNLNVANQNVTKVQAGAIKELTKFNQIPDAPRSYERQYQQAIRMFEMSVDDTIELSPDVFNQLVMDEWDWKDDFMNTKHVYAQSAIRASL